MQFRLEGDTDLIRALEQIEKRSTQIAVTRRALKKAAEPMRAKAEQYAPIDEGDLSSNIRIAVRATGEVGKAAYAATMRKTRGDKVAALAALRTARRVFKASNPPAILYMGPLKEVFYAKFVEFGAQPHEAGGKFAGAQHPGSSPDPFLRPAFDSEADATIARLGPLIWDEVQRQALRAARRRA